MNVPKVKIIALEKSALLPRRAHPTDAGFDVYPSASCKGMVVKAGANVLVGTGLSAIIPKGYCLQVNPRSGKAHKHGLLIGARIIDSGYEGELKINLINHSQDDYELSNFDAIAQLLILPISGTMEFATPDEIQERKSERGEGGFGSTNSALAKRAINKP